MHLKPFFLSDSFQVSGIAKKNVLSAEPKLTQTVFSSKLKAYHKLSVRHA